MRVTEIVIFVGGLGTITKNLEKEPERVKIRSTTRDHPKYSIVKIS